MLPEDREADAIFQNERSNRMIYNAQRKIAVLIEIGAANMVENTINKLISFQIAKYQRAIRQIKQELKPFEEKYLMTSEKCYKRFNDGELGDVRETGFCFYQVF
ncbi:MAG TPA: hypothetical protein DCQ37_03750 [Desulfobacteraceae bacterium]|nr:hypothetical protein [Desulfobacteraceae bacterium]